MDTAVCSNSADSADICLKRTTQPGMAMHTGNHSSPEVETGGSRGVQAYGRL